MRARLAVSAVALAFTVACRDEPPRPSAPPAIAADAAPRPPANLRHVELRVLGMT